MNVHELHAALDTAPNSMARKAILFSLITLQDEYAESQYRKGYTVGVLSVVAGVIAGVGVFLLATWVFG